jgi:ankyrin repeat protein
LNRGKVDDAEKLLDQYPDLELNSTAKFVELPLHLACRRHNEKFVKRLLSLGASPDTICRSGFNALQCMVTLSQSLNTTILEHLTKHSVEPTTYINSCNKKHKTALHYAAKYKSLETIQTLIKYGADVTTKDAKGITPAHLSCSNDLSQMKYHLELAPLSLNETSSEGKTCLWFAVKANKGDSVEWLLRKGANPRIEIMGETPWELAVRLEHLDAMSAFALMEWGDGFNSFIPAYLKVHDELKLLKSKWYHVKGNNVSSMSGKSILLD